MNLQVYDSKESLVPGDSLKQENDMASRKKEGLEGAQVDQSQQISGSLRQGGNDSSSLPLLSS